jgi:hypothetical protein
MAAVFLPRGGGPTRRVLGVVGLAALVLLSGTFWGIAAGLIHPQDSSGPYQSLGVAGNYGLAAGISAGAGLAILIRFGRRGREAVAAERRRTRAGRPRPAHRAIRVADYLIGVMICNVLLGYAAVLKMRPTEVSFAQRLIHHRRAQPRSRTPRRARRPARRRAAGPGAPPPPTARSTAPSPRRTPRPGHRSGPPPATTVPPRPPPAGTACPGPGVR